MYPMGNKVTIRSLKTGKQAFLAGHENLVSALCISLHGNFLASGQVTHHGFKVIALLVEAVRVNEYGVSSSNYLVARRQWS